MIQVAIIEDHITILKNYVEFLENFHNISVVSYCRTVSEFLNQKELCGKVQTLLLDLKLPKLSGEDAIPMIKKLYPGIKIIILTAYEDEEMIDICLRRGADGYILKSSRLFDIYQAICDISEFGAYLSPKILKHLLVKMQYHRDVFKDEKLTRKEKEVVGYLFEGLAYKQISQFMNISHHGVNQHVKNIYKKCMVTSRVELMSKILNEKTVKNENPPDNSENANGFDKNMPLYN